MPGGTSRGVLRNKMTYFIIIDDQGKRAYGECNLFAGLSYDDREGYENKLEDVCKRLPIEKENILPELIQWPSIYFGVETVLKDWHNGSKQIIFPNVFFQKEFTVPINGLVWMGSKDFMFDQIKTKLKEGYASIKLKIGAIDFETELSLIQFIRNQFNADEVEIRLDANGAFGLEEAKIKLDQLASYNINYIEQPIKAGQWQEMAALVNLSPIKIALDEELIGITNPIKRKELINTINPPLLILKPALIGGFTIADEWRKLIEEINGDCVITSALESNIGLNAIAQYAAMIPSKYVHGLGTGQLFTNNIPSPYTVDAKGLHYHHNINWDFTTI